MKKLTDHEINDVCLEVVYELGCSMEQGEEIVRRIINEDLNWDEAIMDYSDMLEYQAELMYAIVAFRIFLAAILMK